MLQAKKRIKVYDQLNVSLTVKMTIILVFKMALYK